LAADDRGALRRFVEADGFLLSAGLAFFFLVCMIPILILGVSLVGFVLSTEQAARHVVGQLTQQFPVYQGQITRALVRIVETRTVGSLLGTAVLVVASTPLFGASRLVLHRLLDVKAAGGLVRNFFRNLVTDAALVLLLSVLLFVTTTVSWIYHGLQTLAINAMLPVPPQWFDLASFGLSLSLSAVMFYLAYRVVPRRRPRVGAALAGAVLASLLWEVAKQLFRIYVQRVGVYDQIYGPLGVLVAFVMFVYYSAVVFVFSGAFVAALDARHRPKRAVVLARPPATRG
jgi:membrane protein